MLISILTRNGQITIPRAVREALGLRPGMRLAFEISGNTAVIHPQPGAMAAFGVLGNTTIPGALSADFRDVRSNALQTWAREAAAEGAE